MVAVDSKTIRTKVFTSGFPEVVTNNIYCKMSTHPKKTTYRYLSCLVSTEIVHYKFQSYNIGTL